MSVNLCLRIIKLSLLGILLSFYACVDQVDPEFNFQSNVIFIDAYALTEAGISTVTINRSVFENDNYTLESVAGAEVQMENVMTGSLTTFTEDSTGRYICPPAFATAVGETWKAYIRLPDGRRYESKPEVVTAPVAIDNIDATFSENIRFEADFNQFTPGHSIRIDWKDPANEDNFYLWKYRSYEPLTICRTCESGILRNDLCQVTENPPWLPKYYNYLCDTTCWMIRYGDEIPILEDRLVDGTTISSKEIAIIPYYRDRDVLVEIQQLSLSASSYDYFKIINDLVSNNSGLNAPPPAALFGNFFNPDDEGDQVLGQLTVAGVSTKRIFIDRSNLPTSPIIEDRPLRLETCFNCPFEYPCIEGFNRTLIKPEGWP